MPDEIPQPEVPPAPPVPPANPPPENLPPAQSPPPAANLVVNGDVTDEKHLAAARRIRQLETDNAELERENEVLKTPPPAAPPVPEKVPVKIKRYRLFPTIINLHPDDE